MTTTIKTAMTADEAALIDVVTMAFSTDPGATPVNEQAKAREVVAAFQESGATWRLEWLNEQRGTFAQMREYVRKGPPRV